MLANLRVLHKRPRVRRQQRFPIALHGGQDAPGDEVGRVFGKPNELIDHFRHLDGDGPRDTLPIRQQKDGHLAVALSQLVEQGRRLRMGTLVVAAKVPIQEDRAERGVGHHDRAGIVERQGTDHVDIALFQRAGEASRRPALCWCRDALARRRR
jgi:hypothetical protein